MRKALLVLGTWFIPCASAVLGQGIEGSSAPANPGTPKSLCCDAPREIMGRHGVRQLWQRLFGVHAPRCTNCACGKPNAMPPCTIQPVAGARATLGFMEATAIPNRVTLEPAAEPASLPSLPLIINSEPQSYARLLDVSGHDENYRWITGVLLRRPGLPNTWFIRYQPPDAVPDRHGGCVAIQTDVPMQNFREGDLVSVNGYIITDVELAPNLRVTGYAALHVNPVK